MPESRVKRGNHGEWAWNAYLIVDGWGVNNFLGQWD